MRRLLILSFLAVAAPLAGAPSAHAALPFSPCPGASGKGLECGTLTVPLDRSGTVPGTLALRVRRVAGTTGSEAVLRLAGGPGQASVPDLAPFAKAFSRALRGKQVVALDTRGTGAGAVTCPPSSASSSLTAQARTCATRLGARLPFLTTAATTADLEQLRQELGAARLTIVATSYGGKVANEYARRYPASVGSLVLDSPTPLQGTDPLARERAAALPRVLSDICAGGGCRGITTSVRADLAAVVAQAVRGRLRGRIGGRNYGGISITALQGLVLTSDLSFLGRAGLPAALAAARRGDTALLTRLLTAGAPSADRAVVDQDVPTGTLAAISCQEAPLPWDPASVPGAARKTLAALPAALFAPFGKALALASGTIPLCAGWPSVPASPPTGAPAPDVPVLSLVGTQDLRTPVEAVRQLTGEYPRGVVVEVPGAGHGALGSDVTGCAVKAVEDFLASGVAAQCPSARRLPAPFAAPPTTVAAAAPIKGIPGTTGKVTSAALASIDDLSEAVVTAALANPRVGRIVGLRSGSATLRRGATVLRGYSSVRGLRLDGTVSLGTARGTLRVTSAAGSGTLQIAGRRVRGTIGGKRLTVRRATASPLLAALGATATSGATTARPAPATAG